MQSEPIQTLQNIPHIRTSEQSNNSQHGLFSEQVLAADLHGSLEQCGNATGSGNAPDDARSRQAQDTPLLDQVRRLSLNNEQRPKASFQWVSEYEIALAPKSQRNVSESPDFQIIRTAESNGGIQINQFPNEVLTHILSYMPATTLSAMALVSRRFYTLATTPHAWRIAFSRLFPGQDALYGCQENIHSLKSEGPEKFRSETRLFMRLTTLASWRSEYVLRTRLLRSLGHGKPAQISSVGSSSTRPNSSAVSSTNPVVTYSSHLFATVNHIHAAFESRKNSPRFIHGSDEIGAATASDPKIGKVDSWGLSDPQDLSQFAERWVGHQPYGLDEGPAGVPNSMDVSQPFGMIVGEGFPGGKVYFRSKDEMRGRYVLPSADLVEHENGIPRIPKEVDAISSVWIAKSNSVLKMSQGLVGMLSGSTLGVVTAYSLGFDNAHGRHIPKGQVTVRWILSPGVPIIALAVDDSYGPKRKDHGRVWAVALNALGELFYLTQIPTSSIFFDEMKDEKNLLRHAWDAGYTACWKLVEPSCRVAREDPYGEFKVSGSYSPRLSLKMQLPRKQLIAETQEIETFLQYLPAYFRKICVGWDMQRKLIVDFAGDNGNCAGEGILVIRCGIGSEEAAEVKRFTRWRAEQVSLDEYPLPKTPPFTPRMATMASSLNGGTTISNARNPSPKYIKSSIVGTSLEPVPYSSSEPVHSLPPSPIGRLVNTAVMEDWRATYLSLDDHPNSQITCSAIDSSNFAILTTDEDPLQTMNTGSNRSSPFGIPNFEDIELSAYAPGNRARLIAVGTTTGSIIMWDSRGSQPTNPSVVNKLHPVRIIYTDSPQISCLAVSALYLVHGGNDGLVQAWDPLASTPHPVRTLHSRFSSRARRRLIQAEASVLGVGVNLYAAGAIVLDPDPTVLRGMVTIGTHLRYWAYSSAADHYQGKKRRLRRCGDRGSNCGPDRFSNTARGALMDYIAMEQEELKNEKLKKTREDARLRGRFGVGLGGLTEEEALRYAEMVSAEEFAKDEERRKTERSHLADINESSSSHGVCSSTVPAMLQTGSSPTGMGSHKINDQFDYDLKEAIRLSLLDDLDLGGQSLPVSMSRDYEIGITLKQRKRVGRSASTSPSTSQVGRNRKHLEDFRSEVHDEHSVSFSSDNLELALQLSLAEEKRKSKLKYEEDAETNGIVDEFPAFLIKEVEGKGKDKAS